MATTSQASWVDGPYKLLTPPEKSGDANAHYAIEIATEMVYVHNIFIRGFNSILLQAPHVPSSGQPGYKAQDVKDLLLFTDCLMRTLHHHHEAEENVGFPELEREIGRPGFLSAAKDQHAAFHDNLEILWDMSKTLQATPEEWTWDAMKKVLDDFMPALEEHLTDEVRLLATLDQFEEDALRRAWAATEAEATKAGTAAFYDVFPIVFTCHDRTYEGGQNFPPIPGFLRYLVNYWFAGRYRGAWRFSPCDGWSNRKPLLFTNTK